MWTEYFEPLSWRSHSNLFLYSSRSWLQIPSSTVDSSRLCPSDRTPRSIQMLAEPDFVDWGVAMGNLLELHRQQVEQFEHYPIIN